MLRKLIPVVFAFGCHKAAPSPTCDQVGAKLHAVLVGSVPAHEGVNLATAQQMAGQCRSSAYSDEVRRCLIGITKPAEVAACRRLQPAPAGSGR